MAKKKLMAGMPQKPKMTTGMDMDHSKELTVADIMLHEFVLAREGKIRACNNLPDSYYNDYK